MVTSNNLYFYSLNYEVNVDLPIYTYVYTHIHTYIHIDSFCQPSSVLQFLENVSGYLWNAFFIWCRILALFPNFVTTLVCNSDGLGTKSVDLNVHRELWKYWNIEYWWSNIARQIRHTCNKEKKLASFVKKLIYKYIILNCYVQIQACCMFPLMFKS